MKVYEHSTAKQKGDVGDQGFAHDVALAKDNHAAKTALRIGELWSADRLPRSSTTPQQIAN
jgi:hypothetical protein